jgi:hypothetical protein
MVHRRIFALSLIALGLCLGRARAQAGPDVFGIQDEGITIVGYQEFFPIYSSCGYSAGDERWCDGQMKAGINMIPNGALVTQVVFYVRDDDSLMNFIGWLCWSSVHSSSGQALLADCQTGVATSGQPGETVVFQNFDPPLPILYRQDVDGDGFTDVVNYYLRVWTQGGIGTVTIRMARLLWKRQVSPAPAVATFNDVPTSHQFFQFIEALAASGITAGCSASPPLYCPDFPLTRGQMAVFLAKALGLHWPWNAQ